MFNKLDTGIGNTLYVLQNSREGRWVSNRFWALLYPNHLLSIKERVAKRGAYRYNVDKKEWLLCDWAYDNFSKTAIDTILPNANYKPARLSIKEYKGFNLTIDYKSYSGSAPRKCFILEPYDKLFNDTDLNIMVRKKYVDAVLKAGRYLNMGTPEIYGTTMSEPIFIGAFDSESSSFQWNAIIMPINAGVNNIENILEANSQK